MDKLCARKRDDEARQDAPPTPPPTLHPPEHR